MSRPLVLDVESFGPANPALNPGLLLEHARVALRRHGASPTRIVVERSKRVSALVRFAEPDARSEGTLEREDFTEKGAIVLAALVLNLEGRQITRVVKARGGRFDYFVGTHPGDDRWILEVGGTDAGSFPALAKKKARALLASSYRKPPHSKAGFSAVTRFKPTAKTGVRFHEAS